MTLIKSVDSNDPSGNEKWAVDAPTKAWAVSESGVWLNVISGQTPSFGWKVHVSATLEEAPQVLSIVSSIAFECGCSFKFLHGVDAFLTLHSKNGSRLQSGKFIALYPASAELARVLMDRLSEALSGYSGMDVLTDRAYKGSSSVYYRWGAFHSSGKISSNGEPYDLIANGSGMMVPDRRAPRFLLPEGVLDVFSGEPALSSDHPSQNGLTFDEFEIQSVLRFTNAGGRYRAKHTRTGAPIFVKEARPHTGYVDRECAITRLDHEVELLKDLGVRAPGLAPKLVKYFQIQGHRFAALEHVDGIPLSEWIARENPLYSSLYQNANSVSGYLKRATKIVEKMRTDLSKLHSLGLAFGDLSSGNIIVSANDIPRLIDFESCTSLSDKNPPAATPDFCLINQGGTLTAQERDEFALNCICIALVLRLTTLSEISDHVLDCLSGDLSRVTTNIPTWWPDACENLKITTRIHSRNKVVGFAPPSMENSASRGDLRNKIAAGIISSYQSDRAVLLSDSLDAGGRALLGFRVGRAGSIGSLISNGCQLDADLVARFARVVESNLDERFLPISYDYGLCGIADTCAALGLSGLVERIIEIVTNEWAEVTDPSLATGLSGVALTLRRHDQKELSAEVMMHAIHLSGAYKWEKNGLLRGRSGVVAGACQFPELLSAEPRIRTILQDLIDEEFAQTVRHPKADSLSLRGEHDGKRLLPYLSDGTAGFLLALALAADCPFLDIHVTDGEMVALASDLGTPFMLEASLHDGATGLAVVLEILHQKFPSLADHFPDPGWGRIRKYLLPLRGGIGVLNPRTLKYDYGHAQGSAGLLEAFLWLDGMASLNLSGLHLPRRSTK